VLHSAGSSVDWYMARASGVVAYLLLTAVVFVGIALAGKVRVRWPRFAVIDVHRFGGILVAVFIGLHVATLALDTYLPFSVTQLVVPFASHYRPLPTALGIVSMELLVAVGITNALRRRLPHRTWRRAHYATFAVWGAATVHGLTAGTDRGTLWLSALYVVSIAAVLTALALRVSRRLRAVGPARIAVPSAAAALLTTLALGAAASPPAPHPPRGFSAALSARIQDRSGQVLGLTSVSGTAARATRQVAFRIDVLGNGEQVAATALQLRYAGRNAAACTGTVSQLDTTGFAGTCRFGDGSTQPVSASWQVTGRTIAGRLHVGLAS
jgi:sulfoxide reductase heme-binding subunit YedZ